MNLPLDFVKKTLWALGLTVFLGLDPAMAGRALFISAIQDPVVFSSAEEMDHTIRDAKTIGVDTLFVQIYQSSRAWFPSQIGDDTPYQGLSKKLGQDPLSMLIDRAHQQGLSVHAWINVLSLGSNGQSPFFKRYGAGILTRNQNDKQTLLDYKVDGQFFLEAGDPRVRNDLLVLLDEILRRYPQLDGVQLDYIRYPDVNPHYGFTPVNMERFKTAQGVSTIDENSEAWKKWKRDQVTELVKALSAKARALRPGLIVSATGCMPFERAFHEAAQDWPLWITEGLVDFVTVMSYTADLNKFKRWVQTPTSHATDLSKVHIGIGVYKLASLPSQLHEQLNLCEAAGKVCVLFPYASIRGQQALIEILK